MTGPAHESAAEGGAEKTTGDECRAALSPGLAAALADPEVAREAGLYAATLPAPPGPLARAKRYVDRGEFAAALATRQGVSERVAAAQIRIAEALRATADEYPDLSDEEAIEALRSMEAGVHRAGVPRRRTPAAGQRPGGAR